MRKRNLNVKKISHKKIFKYLKEKKIYKIYKNFHKNLSPLIKNQNFCAAISGGPDSMALAFLLKCFGEEFNQKCEFYHVNHGIRKNSSLEAHLVKNLMKKINCDLKILKWKGKKPNTNIQSIARINRYNLIFDEMKKKGIKKVFFGHTQEDLFENFFLRLVRGSGLEGFVSLNSISVKNKDFTIYRPLINLEKKDLEYISFKVFGNYIKDPSNYNTEFTRVRVRNFLKFMNSEGFGSKKFKLTIQNLTESNKTINHYVNKNIKVNSKLDKNNSFGILSSSFFSEPNEVVFRSLSKILSLVGNKYYPPRGKKVVDLIKAIKLGKKDKFTLNGCILEKNSNLMLIFKENNKKRQKKHNLPLV